MEVVKAFEKVDPAKVTPSSSFKDDLELDSLDTVELVMAMEEEFAIEIPDTEADRIVCLFPLFPLCSFHVLRFFCASISLYSLPFLMR